MLCGSSKAVRVARPSAIVSQRSSRGRPAFHERYAAGAASDWTPITSRSGLIWAATTHAPAAPLPPERPFDLGTVPNAASPIPLAGSAPGGRPSSRSVVAGLSYSASEPAPASLKETHGFQPLATKDIASLSLRR
jgi:hypothetical protein